MITKFNKYNILKENNNLLYSERYNLFFNFYFRNLFFNFHLNDDSNINDIFNIDDIYQKDHYNLCDTFFDKSKGELNDTTKVFTLEKIQHIYIDYYLEYIIPNYIGFFGRYTILAHEEVLIFENIPMDYIYIIFENMIDFSTQEKIEEYFLNELDIHVDIINFFNKYRLSEFSSSFRNKINHILNAKKFDLL